MSTSSHPIFILSDSNVEDVFFSTNTPHYTPASPDYSPASPRNTAPDSKTESYPLKDPFEDHSALLAISPFYDDPYMKVMQAYNAISNESPIPLSQALIAPPTVLPSSSVFEIGESSHMTRLEHHKEQIDALLNHLDELPFERIEHMEDKIEGLGFLEPLYPGIIDMINDQDIEHMIPPTPPRDTKPSIGSPISLSPSSSVGSSSSVRLTTLLSDYPFDESIFAELDNSMAPKRTSTSAAPVMNQAAIRKLVTNSFVAALEAQATTMANTNNTNRNTRQSKTLVVRKCIYKEFMSCQLSISKKDLPSDIPLESVVVLRYEKRSKNKNKAKVPTEMELELEQTQYGFSYEVSVSAIEVEELKRKVKIKGEKKESILTLRQKSGQYICYLESQR
uniref:Reverse transcriptase domain-containing protein n=1 Tax=Tanacetum cinerariifolium TaxID=118510 RepID=A0A6L2NJ95_TANCI|nr:hypothetical protein [Tanacetum cinerariifolium]